MELANHRLLERIHEGVDADVFLGEEASTGQPRAIKLAHPGPGVARRIAMLQHEYSVTRELDMDGVIRPVSLDVDGEQGALVMEHGGTSLAQLLKESPGGHGLGLVPSLRIAIQVATTLGEIHARGVIHKDIKPSNIIYDADHDRARITDFSISTVLSGQRAPAADVGRVEGTLRYLSPEQTGRMNRTIDFRSDFYSFGITLYELCTGRVPFQSADALELVHCHIARRPEPPHKLNDAIPLCLSAVIMKLIAKTAEERYQSSLSLRADLETCLEAVHNGVEPADFTPGHNDHPEKLQMSQRLYGRDADTATLMAAFDRVSGSEPGQGRTELLLVAGYSGIGKSAIVNEVHRPILARRGYFVGGKFDQFNRNIPYESLILAFQALVSQLLSESPDELAAWKDRLTDALGSNGQVIVDVIPEIELIIGKQPPIGALGPAETGHRFNRTFKSFIRVFATEERPLVLFLDDLQWADTSSLNLISFILSDEDIRHLLLLGAYRDNEVDASHPLMIMLSELGDARERVGTITLAPLQINHVRELIADSLHMAPERIETLATLAMEKTHGNPFFLIQLLSNIYDRGHLRFDAAAGEWSWDADALAGLGYTDNVVDLMVRKIGALEPATQRALRLAACIGNQFELDTLSHLVGGTPREAADALWGALEAGLVVPTSDSYKLTRITDEFDAAAIGHRFLHDRVQQACYATIADDERNAIHLRMARHTIETTPEEEIDDKIFNLVGHLNLGASGITGRDERLEAARLNLRAAGRARLSTAYGPGVECIRAAIEFLPEDAWETEYELALALYTELVDLEYLTLDFESAEAAADIVTAHARTVIDRIRVYEVRIQYYVGQNRMPLAIETVKEVLELLEIPLSDELPDNLDVTQLDDLQPMTDPRYLAAMRILMSSMPAVYIAAPELLPLVSFTMIRLTVNHGESRIACYAYSLYALIMAGVLGEFDVGYAFGQLALRVQQKVQAVELESKVYALHYIFVHHWKRHLRDTLDGLLHGVKTGIATGDVEYAGYNAVHYSTFYLFCGDELSAADARLKQYVDLSADLKQEYGYYYIRVWRQMVHALRDPDAEREFISGPAFDEHTETEGIGPMLPVLCSLHAARMMQRYFFGNFAGTVESAAQAEEVSAAVAGFVTPVLISFYQSLGLLARVPELADEARAAALEKVDAELGKLENWASAQPENNRHKHQLVLAERARALGSPLEAMKGYEAAIASAHKSGFLHEEALAIERAAFLYDDIENFEIGRHYRRRAHALYAQWGAHGKCAAMADEYPYLNVGRTGHFRSVSMTTTQTATGSGSLDLMSVVKASQALAGEIVQEKLLEKLMTIVMENVGAERGVLVLRDHDAGMYVAATADAEAGHVRVLQTPLDEFDAVPATVVQFAHRTGKAVVLDDAHMDPRYGADPYIAAAKSRSVLCSPIEHSGKATGLFYFENNLAPGVFTAARLEVLGLLSAQVSISIENARLYNQLEDYTKNLETKVEARTEELSNANGELRASLDEIQRMQKQIIVQEKLASLGTLTAGIAHELRNPLNFVNNFAAVNRELTSELEELLAEVKPAAGAESLTEAIEVVGEISSTSERIHDHGNRAAGIISNMLLHASNTRSEHMPADLNEVVENSVNLAYHGVKAKNQNLQLQIERDYASDAGAVSMSRAEVARVIINLVNNACYATQKRMAAEGAEYVPQLAVSTRREGDRAVIVFRDNGTGIPHDVLGKLFNPFFTTKPTGEGTGLGLSLSHDIIVQGHNGELTARSAEGEYAEFTITLPV